MVGGNTMDSANAKEIGKKIIRSAAASMRRIATTPSSQEATGALQNCFLSLRDSVGCFLDMNPILDKVNPSYTSSLEAAARLCDVLGIPLDFHPPTAHYCLRWCINGHASLPALCSWTLCTQDLHGRVTHLTVDLFDDDSPLLVGIDVHEYSAINFTIDPAIILFKEPTEDEQRCFPIYIRGAYRLK